MMEQGVFESAASKRNQFELATQVVKMILKIDDVIAPTDYEWVKECFFIIAITLNSILIYSFQNTLNIK